MTQMMLFDASPVASAATAVASAVAPQNVAHSPVSARSTPATASPAVAAKEFSQLPQPLDAPEQDGVQRMGDLARLVLLRYQLVAQRRQEMAARRAK